MAPRKGAGPRELFGVNRLDKLLLDSRAGSAQACIGRIRAEVAAFCENAPPADDQTLIAVRCL